MANRKNKLFFQDEYQSPFEQTWTNRKHLYSQVKGQTQQTQNLIILEHQTRKQS
ncbi:MAG TPA: YpzG family protein [Bacillus sp. (in: firmicutes)]|uniref:YpzG-like protein n=1 Tax=Bacillus oleivorans TaxID=1448271 RepID=A0A285CTD5_9BACI|nr:MULTISPECIES: YpzG family protein [Bacillus]SNX70316.1 YpzG-like protein [Bacillus oleivorans]HWO74670.1 YpzG family protein [Bacillus sp. (in: firmicutes)]